MGVSGRCAHCETREARHSCPRCGALVCPDHYRETAGVCVECAGPGGGRRIGGGDVGTAGDRGGVNR